MERGGVRDGRIWVLALVSYEPGPNHLPPRLWEIPSGAGPATLGMGPGRVGVIAPKQALSSVVLGTSQGQARGRWLKRSQGARVAEGLCPTRLGCLPCEAEEAPRGQALPLQPQCPLSEGGSWDSPNALGVKRRRLCPFCQVPTSATSWP